MSKISFAILTLLFLSCSSSKIVKLTSQGSILQSNFTEQLDFNYEKRHLFIDVVINGKTLTFLFDTGYEISTIDKSLLNTIDFQAFKKYKSKGSSFDAQKIQYGFLSSLRINNIEFQNIGIGIQDLSFIKSPFPDKRKISGVIGANIFRKAYWQINYKNKTIRFSDDIKNLEIEADAFVIKTTPRNKKGWGNKKIDVLINRSIESFIFDTGSSGGFSGNYKLLERIESKKATKDTIINIDELTLGAIKLKNTKLSIEKGIGLLIGNKYWENFIITIDWGNNKLFLTPLKNK